jgi:hypothetical protein
VENKGGFFIVRKARNFKIPEHNILCVGIVNRRKLYRELVRKMKETAYNGV